jgi:hypothetical protein
MYTKIQAQRTTDAFISIIIVHSQESFVVRPRLAVGVFALLGFV